MNEKRPSVVPLLLIAAALLVGFVPARGCAPDGAELPGKGLRVLIVEEVDERTSEIAATINSGELQGYLLSHCAKDEQGNPQYRILDEDTDTANLSPLWREALKIMADQKRPSMLVTNGRKKGYRGPLPMPAGEAVKLLKKYGGE